MHKFTDPSQIEEVKKIMQEKPVIIFFYMDGCPHCENTRPAWEELANSGLPHEFAEVESSAVPPESGIHGFPHFLRNNSDGSKKEAGGSKKTAKELGDSLGIKFKKAGSRLTRRRRSRRLSRRVRKRLHRS